MTRSVRVAGRDSARAMELERDPRASRSPQDVRDEHGCPRPPSHLTLSVARPVPRRGLSRVEAAMYIGISPLAPINPARDVPYFKSNNPFGYHTWNLEEVHQYEERHSIDKGAACARALAAVRTTTFRCHATRTPARPRQHDYVHAI